MAERSAHTDAEIDAAIEALSDPERLEQAQRLVADRAPQLQRILDEAHARAVAAAAAVEDPGERIRAVRALVEEETRVSMLTGVAVGYELAHTLMQTTGGESDGS